MIHYNRGYKTVIIIIRFSSITANYIIIIYYNVTAEFCATSDCLLLYPHSNITVCQPGSSRWLLVSAQITPAMSPSCIATSSASC
jgi:hypothetical protein